MVGDLLEHFPVDDLVIPNINAPTHCIYLVGSANGILSLTIAPFSDTVPSVGQALSFTDRTPFGNFFRPTRGDTVPDLAYFERGYVYALRQSGKSITELESMHMYCKTYFSFSQSHRCYAAAEEHPSTGCSFEEAGSRVCVTNSDRTELRRRMRRENRTGLLDAMHLNQCAISESTLLGPPGSGFIADVASVCNTTALIHSHTHRDFLRIHTNISDEIPVDSAIDLKSCTLEWHQRTILDVYLSSWNVLETKTGSAYKQLLLHRLMHRAGAVGARLPCLSALCIVTPSAKRWIAPLVPENCAITSLTLQLFIRGIRDQIPSASAARDAYTAVLLQILYNLQVLREVRLGHYDLHASNILVNEWRDEISMCLDIDGHEGCFEMQTRYTVHFIDWDMAAKHALPKVVRHAMKRTDAEVDPRTLALSESVQRTQSLLAKSSTSKVADGGPKTFCTMYGIQHDEFNPIADLFCFLGEIYSMCENKHAVFFAHPDIISPSGVGIPNAVDGGSLEPSGKTNGRIVYWIPSTPLLRVTTFENGNGPTRTPFVLSPRALQSPLSIILNHPQFRHLRRPPPTQTSTVSLQLFSTIVGQQLGLDTSSSIVRQIRLDDAWVEDRMPYDEEWGMVCIA
jgi:hypothetical protein